MKQFILYDNNYLVWALLEVLSLLAIFKHPIIIYVLYIYLVWAWKDVFHSQKHPIII